MQKRGKCKIDIKYIEDDRKRSDTLYKRRRGLIKKAHELSVICGLKISIVCTDFERTCFSFSNDERLDYNLERVLGSINKPVWLTRFFPEDYPFSSVKGETKEKVLFGRKIDEIEANESKKTSTTIDLPTTPTQFSSGKESLLSKRGLPDLLTTTSISQQEQQDNLDFLAFQKRLKIDKKEELDRTSIDLETPENLHSKSFFFNLNPKFLKSNGQIPREEFEDHLVVSLRKTIDELKRDDDLINHYLKIDPTCFEKLETFRTEINQMTLSKMIYLDCLFLRYFIAFYFSTEAKQPFDRLKKIPPAQIFKVISQVKSVEIDKINEIFLMVLLAKIKPKRNFDFLEEASKIEFCSKLYSIKRVHVKRMMVGKVSSEGKNNKMKTQVEKLKKNPMKLQAPSSIILQELFEKHQCSFVVMQDNWLVMTINEIIGMCKMQLLSNMFLDNLPKYDFKKVAAVVSKTDHKGIPFLKEVLELERKKNLRDLSEKTASIAGNFMDLLGPGAAEKQFSDSNSQVSGFSFNFSQNNGPPSTFFDF